MPYAVLSDITELYGPDVLYVADRDGDGVADVAAVARALDQASDEIDSFVGVRHVLPLPVVPGILRQHAVDIAVYRLALSRNVLTDEHRVRYEDALGSLKRISEGKASLNLPVSADPGGDEDGDDYGGPQPIVSAGPPRLFSREKMRGV